MPESVRAKKGKEILNFALNQPSPVKKKNEMTILGCLFDLKRTGDFMQSASIQLYKKEDLPNSKSKGIFATNDRIAAYISAKIHNNYTILSSMDRKYATSII